MKFIQIIYVILSVAMVSLAARGYELSVFAYAVFSLLSAIVYAHLVTTPAVKTPATKEEPPSC